MTILDLGCGTGETGMVLKQKYGAKVIGVSISEQECEISNQLLDKCYQYNLENGLPFNFYTHFRWYTFKSAERLFNKHGFKTSIKDVTVSLPFGRILNRIISEKIKIKITQFLKKISRGFFGWELVYVFQLLENEE